MHLRPMICACHWWLVLPVNLLVIGWSTDSGQAGTGYAITVPQLQNRTPGFSKQSGLQLEIDSRWVGERGYRPVHIEVKAQKAANADQQLTVRFSALSRRNSKVISVEQDFELSQANTTASTRLLVPQFVDWNITELEMWVDGIKDKELSLGPVGLRSN